MKLSRQEELQGWYDYEEHHKKVENTMKDMGLKEGLKEAKKEMIKNMINENISYEIISKVSGIDKDKIDKFLNS